MDIMSERNELTWKIREELKNFKSNRKATIKLLSLVSNSTIFMGNCRVFCDDEMVHINQKYNLIGTCWICSFWCSIQCFDGGKKLINSNTVEFYLCHGCEYKTLCHSCLRETSRCRQIHSRKLLTWQILLQNKFPKDVIRLITKKVK